MKSYRNPRDPIEILGLPSFLAPPPFGGPPGGPQPSQSVRHTNQACNQPQPSLQMRLHTPGGGGPGSDRKS